jgi:hypothetical protein
MLTVGVWVGNTDANDPMTAGIIGIAGAGYIFHDVMDWAAKNYKWAPDASFPIPSGLALGTFNCNTGLAPYKDSKPTDLDCVAHPAPGFSGVNPYDPDRGINHRPDTDIYIQGQIPQQS